MNRTTLSLAGAVVALAAVTGVASLTAPDGTSQARPAGAAGLPVQQSTLLCPTPSSSDLGETDYTSFTPLGSGSKGGTARLTPAAAANPDGGEDKSSGKSGKGGKSSKKDADGKTATEPLLTADTAGKPRTATADGSDATALTGTADGALAPGWTVQQTTTVSAGSGRGLLGTACSAPDTDFWFAGASTAKGRQDYVHLTNPDATPAVVDVELRGADGRIDAPTGENLTVPAHASLPVLLSTLTGAQTDGLGVHVVAREGRVGAQLQATDDTTGGDWLPASAEPAASAVLPGVPSDAGDVQLTAVATGSADVDLKVQLATPTGLITPAGTEDLHVKGGMTQSVDLKKLTQGEAGSLVLTPADSGDRAAFAAALRVTRGSGSNREMAFIPATAPLEREATAADNRAKGSTLSLVAPRKGEDARVKVTASPGDGGGTAVSKTYTVKGGTTLAVHPPVPSGLKGSYALTVHREGGGPLYAARTLALPQDDVPAFTVQTLPDDGGVVRVPSAEGDLSLLTR
ncbi:DUF5719 family protein [Streptomyces sp. NPDC059740]|uniref:DUF5719 family protein n=1 Tax=Streptomyces sp. NPDC059740 TaxID=3346926 RepID=UPI003648E22B